MTFHLAWPAYCDMLSWKFFSELSHEQQVAVRLRWGNRISEWYWEEVHIQAQLIEGAQNMTQLEKVSTLLGITLEGEEGDTERE